MRTSYFRNCTVVRVVCISMALPLGGCDWLIKPCASDLLNTPENRASAGFSCFCTLDQKANPKHICCIDAGTCSEDSDFPDPENSDPAGQLSIGVYDMRTEPSNQFSRTCDGGTAKFDFQWYYGNRVNGRVGAWSEYGLVDQPQFIVDKIDLGGAPVHTADAGWVAMAEGETDPHRVPVDLPAGHYVGSISKLPLSFVQNANAATNRDVQDLRSGDPWYDTVCGTGGAGG